MARIQSTGAVTAAGVGISALRYAVGEPDEARQIEQLRAPAGSSREQRLRFARSSRLAKLCLLAAWDATDSLPDSAPGGGVVLGTAHGAHLSNEEFFAGLTDGGVAGASPRLFSQTLPSSASAEVSIQLGLTGPMMTFAEGIGAGLSALALAARLVDSGRAPWMLAGAADTLGKTLLAALRTGGDETDVTEAAAMFVLVPDQHEDLVRVAGSGRATGADARASATTLALKEAEIEQRDLASVWDHPAENSLHRALGDCFATSPLLAACLALDSRRLPALIRATDARLGSVDALCLR